MIPPSNTLEDADTIEKNEHEQTEQPQSPTSTLQKLKRSLSFKTKSLRSKSVENFFQRTNSDMKLQVDLLSKVSTSTGQLSTLGSLTSSPTKSQKQVDTRAHSFMEHVFKKPTFCDVCNHMIVGTNAKHGLRCKACKMSIHYKCADGMGQQRCMGKLPKGFQRYYSSPLLIQEQFGCIKEVMPMAKKLDSHVKIQPGKTSKCGLLFCSTGTDSHYSTMTISAPHDLCLYTDASSLGYGGVQGNEWFYDSWPHEIQIISSPRNLPYSRSSSPLGTSDLAEVPEETDAHGSLVGPTRKRCDSDSVFTSPENGTEHFHTEQKKLEDSPAKRQQHKDLLQLNTYVALFKFVPQDNEDLEMSGAGSGKADITQVALGTPALVAGSQAAVLGSPATLLGAARLTSAQGTPVLAVSSQVAALGNQAVAVVLAAAAGIRGVGTIEDRVGYFPANFAHQVKAGEKVYRCTRTFIGCKEQGQIILKEGQICVANKEETNGFIIVSSGKKKGFVPFDVLENV
ncbi:SH3 and cysteine-rich domain-containing protein [Acipenser ruthenus]|uniref:SH3 and cysteine-rich domain-containing protein n=1 Tax=Acipenser ruthenus TaxID=7906 RepID=A0A444TXA2_ACIRT|nr:SH3 and cysteine-rich domain-containing protein [Acipenser ruthenus]